jgi:ADP-ribose pyrophosphatase YjhB (NUDIX family)
MFDTKGDELKVLLIRRKNHPWIGCRALPGGFVDPGECAEEAAARELEEETHLKGLDIAPCGFYSTPGRDPRSWVVSRGFFAVTDGLQRAEAGDDAAEADWFTLREESQGSPFVLVLRFMEEELRITGEYERQPLTGLLQVRGAFCEDLASDHAAIISDAYMALRRCREVS